MNEKTSRGTGSGHSPAVGSSTQTLGDFTTTLRVLPISTLAIVIGAVCSVVAE